MPTGEEFGRDVKQLMFRVIKFIDSEKSGAVIPLYKTTDRLETILGISRGSISGLRSEMYDSIENEQNESDDTNENKVQLRKRAASDASVTPKNKRREKRKYSLDIPIASSPQKKGYSGRKVIELTEQQQDNIRYHFHLMLAEKMYPTLDKLLRRLLDDDLQFPVTSRTTLWRWMKKLGFEYKRTSTISIPLDAVSFMAQRAKYFRKVDEIRSNGSFMYYHDETWANSGEEKRRTWYDPKTRSGRLRNNDTKGTRLAISALISIHGFHLPSVEIFKCDQDHSMDANHFIDCVSRTCSFLRKEHGSSSKISIIIDNATWHNTLTEETKPPKRAWNKQQLIDWLDFHQLTYPNRATKAELLEVAFENAPEKKYVVDEAAQIYGVDIIRLPVKHCSLNPIELAWAGMKSYIRDNNTSFRLSDVERFASEWIGAVDESTAQSYFAHTYQHELVFKQADAFAEEVENQLIDDDDGQGQITMDEAEDQSDA